MMWGIQKSLSKIFWKIRIYYFVIKCCEDFEKHCWKIEKNSILLYSNCNEMIWGFQKSLSKKIWKILILMYCIVLWWNDVRISQVIVDNFGKNLFLGILSFCNEVMWGFQKKLLQILNLYFMMFFQIFTATKYNRIQKSNNLQNLRQWFWKPRSISSQSVGI